MVRGAKSRVHSIAREYKSAQEHCVQQRSVNTSDYSERDLRDEDVAGAASE